jgi:hypothetical protein
MAIKSKEGEDTELGRLLVPRDDRAFHDPILDNLFAERKSVGISRTMAKVMIDATEKELDVIFKLPEVTTEE